MKGSKLTEKVEQAQYDLVLELERRNNELIADNKLMAEKLNSKRHKAIDFVVDGFYRLVRKANNKKIVVDRSLNNKKESMSSYFERKVEVGRIDIINVNFYDWDGKVLYKGGAERYVYDLACLLKAKGFKPRLLQCSNEPFEKKYKGIDVIGIGAGSKSDMRVNSVLFSGFCKDAELIIASPLELACEMKGIPVIGINHGINFDGDWNKYNKKCLPDYSIYIDALKNVKSCVCVDTNFINWTRTIDYDSSLKEVYIPNYYDEKIFSASPKRPRKDSMTFVYPRRIYNARGADITIAAFDELFERYGKKIKLKFVGQIDNNEIGEKLHKLMKKYPALVSKEEYDMKDMHKAYEEADVVLVPTRYCEGTSLSCIEGMVSGSVIITTTVGGLPNLVIDGYNGCLISPSKESLVEAATFLIENPKEVDRMAKNGKLVAKAAFNKDMWDKKWAVVLSSIIN